MTGATSRELDAWRASADLYQRFLTGLILRAVVFKGESGGDGTDIPHLPGAA